MPRATVRAEGLPGTTIVSVTQSIVGEIQRTLDGWCVSVCPPTALFNRERESGRLTPTLRRNTRIERNTGVNTFMRQLMPPPTTTAGTPFSHDRLGRDASQSGLRAILHANRRPPPWICNAILSPPSPPQPPASPPPPPKPDATALDCTDNSTLTTATERATMAVTTPTIACAPLATTALTAARARSPKIQTLTGRRTAAQVSRQVRATPGSMAGGG